MDAGSEATGPLDSDETPTEKPGSRAETTERILDAAEELFASRAPGDVTVRDVAEAAGVTHALVHSYLGTCW